jgi:LytS/YehU family sensor histidine kinase
LPTRRLLRVVFVLAVPVSIAYAAVNYTAFYVVMPSEMVLQDLLKYPEKHHSPLGDILDSALNWYFFIVAWGISWMALSYADRVRLAERQSAIFRAEAQSAELRALRYQVSPHFLFNTLNSLSALVLVGRNSDAEQMIINLATFFRSSLGDDPTADVSLAEEMAMQKLYLAIEMVRFPKRLIIYIDVPDDLVDVRVPGLILQPLVENAIKHGVARSQRPVTVRIRARDDGKLVRIEVEDDGEAETSASSPATGVGLGNVLHRLKARFGADVLFAAGSLPSGGFRAVIGVPRRPPPFNQMRHDG